MENCYLDLIPTFKEATNKLLTLPVDSKRRLHAATKYEGKTIVPTGMRKKSNTRKKYVKQTI